MSVFVGFAIGTLLLFGLWSTRKQATRGRYMRRLMLLLGAILLAYLSFLAFVWFIYPLTHGER